MGPIVLFDKSFLQSLSLNESVFFDHFFLPVICPIFYVETLADLDKTVREGRTPEQEVGIIEIRIIFASGRQNIGLVTGYKVRRLPNSLQNSCDTMAIAAFKNYPQLRDYFLAPKEGKPYILMRLRVIVY